MQHSYKVLNSCKKSNVFWVTFFYRSVCFFVDVNLENMWICNIILGLTINQ